MKKPRKTPGPRHNRISTILVRPAPGKHSAALVQFGPLVIRASIGRNGRTIFKREGDGATPVTRMKLLYGYMRGDRVKAARTCLPLKRIAATMLWCDDSSHPAYNRPVSAPFASSHETLVRDDNLYDICLVPDWNLTSRRRNCGSAIFFHLARSDYEPTAGCVAIRRRDMLRLLPHLKKGTTLRVL